MRFRTLLLACTIGFVHSAASAQPPRDPLRAAVELEEAFQQVVTQVEPSIACVLVARGEPYDAVPPARPGVLGEFPSSETERAAATKRPGLDPRHPGHVPDQHGSGVALEARGLVLTNEHLVRDARKIYVRFAGGRGSYADIHAADPRSDLAVLRLLDERIAPRAIKLGDVAQLRKGQFLLALTHSPSATSPSAAWGILANFRRRPAGAVDPRERTRVTLHECGTLLQTDARLPAAASGGALVNLKGELVGLTTSLGGIGERDGGWAIPVGEPIKGIIDVLKSGREVEYGFLGVETEEADGVVRVSGEATPGTPAARAGLRARDQIVALNGTPIRNNDDLFLAVSTALAGSTVPLVLQRDGQRQTVEAQLAKLAPLGKVIASQPPAEYRGVKIDHVTVLIGQAPPGRDDWPEKVEAALKQGGVVVRAVTAGSAGEQAGVQVGDVISHVNSRAVASPAEFQREMQNLKSADAVELTLLPVGRQNPARKVTLK